jgi:intracellular sulfur oxidation DsrE/DsrF family protein
MKVVFHLNWNNEDIFRLALSNMENLLKAEPKAQIRVLVNGRGVLLFRSDDKNEEQTRISGLMQRGVTFNLCANALRTFKVSGDEILPGCEIVPAGVVTLIELQGQGYAYIKP